MLDPSASRFGATSLCFLVVGNAANGPQDANAAPPPAEGAHARRHGFMFS